MCSFGKVFFGDLNAVPWLALLYDEIEFALQPNRRPVAVVKRALAVMQALHLQRQAPGNASAYESNLGWISSVVGGRENTCFQPAAKPRLFSRLF